jgi:flagellar motor switch protein FliN
VSQPGPWNEHREIAEAMAQAMVDALVIEAGAEMQLGKPTNFEPSEMLGPKPTPLRAYVVNLEKPLRDVLIVFTSLGRELIEPMLGPGVRAVLAAINIGSTEEEPNFTIDEVVEYDTSERAVDQADALFLEASYEISMPLGDIRLVLGTGLLESATSYVNGEADVWAGSGEQAAAQADGADAMSLDAEDPAALIDFSSAAAANAAVADADDVTTNLSASAIDAFDQELAAQEAQADAILAGHAAEVASANLLGATAAATAPGELQGTARWASLLSGVEVELSAELGRTNLELGDITSLVENRILTLDQMVEEPLTVFVNGTAYATARLVIVDDEYGIEILELLDQVDIQGVTPTYSQIAA